MLSGGGGTFGEDEEAFVGTPASRFPMVPWARCNRIYVRSPTKPPGVVMLLVTKVGPLHPGTWAAADPTNRVVMIDLGEKMRVLTKPVATVEWTERSGVSAKGRGAVVTAAERAIARLEVEDAGGKVGKTAKKPPPKKKTSAKSSSIGWLAGGIGNVFAALWAKRS